MSISNLRVTLRDKEILSGVDLNVAGGTILALLGANGSGKTTLMRVLAGVLRPTSGSAIVCGRPPGLGLASFLPSGDRMLNWRLTGRQNLEFYAELAGVRRSRITATVAAAAAQSDGSGLLEVRVGECSTGQRRRLMLAAALVGSPPVILLDEPFADLDDAGTVTVAASARRWADLGGAVLYAAPSDGQGPAPDRIAWLGQGRLGSRS